MMSPTRYHRRIIKNRYNRVNETSIILGAKINPPEAGFHTMLRLEVHALNR